MSKTSKLEDFVPFEIAQKLKEKGYPLLRVIKQRGEPIIYDLPQNHPNWQNCNAYYIPTISQVLKWLREEKKIHIGVLYHGYYAVWIQPMKRNEAEHVIHDCKTHEGAELEGIDFVLDNLI